MARGWAAEATKDETTSSAPVLALRGLRVRIGLHSGVPDPKDCTHNPTTGRKVYGGPAMKAAKLIGDAAAGGMVRCHTVCLSSIVYGMRMWRPQPVNGIITGMQCHKTLVLNRSGGLYIDRLCFWRCGVCRPCALQVLMSNTTFDLLLPTLHELLPIIDGSGPVRVIYCGDVDMGDVEGGTQRSLYQLVTPIMVPRVGYLPPLRNVSMVQVCVIRVCLHAYTVCAMCVLTW